MKYDLSILIPSRGEMFITRTVEDILKNKRGKTQIIVGLDGYGNNSSTAWPIDGIPDHPDVVIVHVSESRGQRGMTNTLCKLSDAKYIAKCDAHCAFDEGFDVKLMEAMQGHDDWTVVPTMRNLHAFNWKCMKCGKQTYQGPTPGTKNGIDKCDDCGNTDYSTFKRKILWYPKPSPQSKSYCFDSEPHFQYFKEFNKRPEGQGYITPSMSLQGSFFMLTRQKYWELNICDETFGSWGSQGIEVACKTWLSGGQVMCVQTTWYAHMFRTQGGDFSFPYPMPGSMADKAKKLAKEMWFNNKFEKQTRPLSWLLEKFWPVPGWGEEDLKAVKASDGPSRGIIYYTDNQLQLKIAHPAQAKIREIAQDLNLPIVSCSLKPMSNMGTNIVLNETRGYLTMFKQILAALEASTADIIYFCEHDVLYHPSHFDFIPKEKNKFYYNQNWWKVRDDGLAVHWDADQVSGLVCYRQAAIDWYKKRIETYDKDNFDRKFEPMSGEGSESWKSDFPNIDIRHNHNLTYNKWELSDFRNKATAVNFEQSTIDKIPGWENLKVI